MRIDEKVSAKTETLNFEQKFQTLPTCSAGKLHIPFKGGPNRSGNINVGMKIFSQSVSPFEKSLSRYFGREQGGFKTLINALILLIIMLFANSTTVSGADNFNTTGTTGFVFLNLPVSARFASMGETGITMYSAGADGLFVNPGLIARAENQTSINMTHGQWYVDTQHQSLGITRKFGNFGTLGLMLNYFDFGDIQKTRTLFSDEVGNLTAGENNLYYDLGTYSANALAVGVAYSRYLTYDFTFGALLKYAREAIDSHTSENVLLDLGFVYNTGIGSLRIGTFLKNFGLESEYEDEQFKMPQRLVLGISGEVLGSLEAANYLSMYLEAIHPNDAAEHIHLGMEGKLINALYLRGGYKFGYDHENLTLGLGTEFVFRARQFRFDISYMNHEYLEQTLRYSLSMEL